MMHPGYTGSDNQSGVFTLPFILGKGMFFSDLSLLSLCYSTLDIIRDPPYATQG